MRFEELFVMTYKETATLEEGGSGMDSARHDSELSPEVRQWTIKSLDVAVVQKARKAAQQEGMKISTWVALAIEHAADATLRGSPFNRTALSNDVNELVSTIEEIRKAERERFEKIEADLSLLIKGQHGMLTAMISGRDRNQQETVRF